MFAKDLKTNQNAGFFKLQYLTKNLRNFWIWLEVQEGPRYQLAASSGCAQVHQNMPKMTRNKESALSQE